MFKQQDNPYQNRGHTPAGNNCLSARWRLRILRGALIAGALSPVTTVNAMELWVDRNSYGGQCSDSRSREEITPNTPWCTIGQAGVSVIPGDNVYVRGGTYSEIQGCIKCWGAILQVVTSGTANQPIRFTGQPGETVEITNEQGAGWGILVTETSGTRPRYVEIRGFKVSGDFTYGCVVIQDTEDVVLSDLSVTGCSESAVKMTRTQRVTLHGSSVFDNPLEGWTSAVNLWLCGSGHTLSGNSIWGNADLDTRDTEGHGIILDTCGETGGALIENNVIWGNDGFCVNVYNSENTELRNNTCWMNGLGRQQNGGEISIKGSFNSVHNNILVSGDGSPGLRIYGDNEDFSTISADFNLIWSPYHEDVVIWHPWTVGTVQEYKVANGFGWGQSSIQEDPNFENAATYNFSLQANSPAIDTGHDPNSSSFDYLGFPRPIDGNSDGNPIGDRGAFEYGGIFVDRFESGGLLSWSTFHTD